MYKPERKFRSELQEPVETAGYGLENISPTPIAQALSIATEVVRDAAGKLWKQEYSREKGLGDVNAPEAVLIPYILGEDRLHTSRMSAADVANRHRGGMWSVG